MCREGGGARQVLATGEYYDDAGSKIRTDQV